MTQPSSPVSFLILLGGSVALYTAVTVFWLVMNVLLWKAEHYGARVPMGTVARRILNPEEDINHFDIYLKGHDQPIGSFTWTAKTLDDEGKPLMGDDLSRPVGGYTLELGRHLPQTDGAVTVAGQRVRFDLTVHYNARHEWRQILLTFAPEQLGGGDPTWGITINANTTNRVIRFSLQRPNFRVVTREKTFADLGQWHGLLDIASWTIQNTFGEDNLMNKMLANMLNLSGETPLPQPGQPAPSALGSFDLEWEARYGPLPGYSSPRGTPPLRVYRLEAPLPVAPDPLVVYVGQNGEILRAQIPFANIEIRNRRFFPRPASGDD